MKKDFFETEQEYNDYVESTPLEARFDPLTIEMAVTEAFPKHEAYGMLFKDYHVHRVKLSGYDESEKKRLSFRFSGHFAHVATDIALSQNVSLHRALVLLIELGLIHFQVDYHDDYQSIRDWRLNSYKGIVDLDSERKYKRIVRHEIKLDPTITGGATAHFVPSVPEWLYNAVMDTKSYLNMSASDFIFFCWCYGCVNCFEDTDIPDLIMDGIKSVCSNFEYEVEEYQNQIKRLE